MNNSEIYREIKESILRLVMDLKPLNFKVNIDGVPESINDHFFGVLFNYRYKLKKEILRDIDFGISVSDSQIEKELKKQTWHALKGRLMEILYALTVIQFYGISTKKRNLFGECDYQLLSGNSPIPIQYYTEDYFLWTQAQIPSTISGLKAIPDIVITIDEEFPNKNNIHTILECKCMEKIDASTLRKEFGKAYDLSTINYVIINFYKCDEEVIEKARKLGLELISFEPLPREAKDSGVPLENCIFSQIKQSLVKNSFLNSMDSSASLGKQKLMNN